MFPFDHKYIKANTIPKEIGNSAYYPYQETPDDNRWAVKVFITNKFDDLNHAVQEAVLGFRLDHRSILTVQGYFLEHEGGAYKLFTKVPRMQKTLEDLIQNHIQNKTQFRKKEILQHCGDLLSAIEYLDSMNISHRDIQPEKIFIDEEGSLKLTDFSQAKFFKDKPSEKVNEVIGSYYYLSPDLNPVKPGLMNKELSRCDVWSVGIIMLEMCLIRKDLIRANENRQRKAEIVREYLEEVVEKHGKELATIIEKLLCLNPRPKRKCQQNKRRGTKRVGRYCCKSERRDREA